LAVRTVVGAERQDNARRPAFREGRGNQACTVVLALSADGAHRIVVADLAVGRRAQAAHPLQARREPGGGVRVVAVAGCRRAHPALHGECFRHGHHEIGAVGGRHQKVESSRCLRHPGLDGLGEVITAEGLIGHDHDPAHGRTS